MRKHGYKGRRVPERWCDSAAGTFLDSGCELFVLFLFPLKQKKTNEFCILARGETIWTIIKSAALQTALRGYNYQRFAELGDNVGLLTWSKYYRQYCQHSRIMLTMFTVFISKVCMQGFVRRNAHSVLLKVTL